MSATYQEAFRQAMISAMMQPCPLLALVYSIKEAADIAECDTDTLAARAQSGDVPAIKWGRSWRFPALAFHVSLNVHASMPRSKEPSQSVGKQQPAANDPVKPARGARKPPPLPDLKTAA